MNTNDPRHAELPSKPARRLWTPPTIDASTTVITPIEQAEAFVAATGATISLLRDRQIVLVVDHLCAQQTGFGERSFQKIILQRQRSDLGVQRLHVDGRELRRSVAVGAEYELCRNLGDEAIRRRGLPALR